jgi:type III secretory pathway component EscT
VAAIVTSLLEKRRSICSFNLTVSIACPSILHCLLVTYVFWFLARSSPDGVCYLPERVSASTG